MEDDPCLVKREEGEPMFVLLARDSTAPAVMEKWCALRDREIQQGTRPNSDEEVEHVFAVRQKIIEFRRWRRVHRG
jgi:hypothetical protein